MLFVIWQSNGITLARSYTARKLFLALALKKKGHQMLRYDVVKHQLKPLHVSSIPQAGSSEIHHNNLAIKKVKKV